ncbi:MAG: hypothetical protein EG828_01685 [Deltaproteobacteria bacterium]|nr:hypothetical protein [Deltaproteobacteria bacterium]
MNSKRACNGIISHRLILYLVVAILFCGCGGGGSSSTAPASTAEPDTPPETEDVSFYAYNFVDRGYYALSASRVAEGDHCYIYLQKDQVVAAEAIEKVKNEFDKNIYPNLKEAFGDEPNPGVDKDPKVYLLLLNVRDGYSDSSSSYIAGYFDPNNEYESSGLNKKELLYMNLNPAPGIKVGEADFNDTLAHEFQHMIHWEQKNHLKSNPDDAWLDEAMSTVAGTYCDYGPSWYNVWIYEQDPSNSLTVWGSAAEDYGVVYMWAQYLIDRYPDPDPSYRSIFKRMMEQDSIGIDSVNNALAAADYDKKFPEIFRDLSIAVFSGKTSWLEHPEWFYLSVETKFGDHGDGYALPGLFPLSRHNVTDLPPLGPYSMNFYYYSHTTPFDGTLAWTQAGANNSASFVDSTIPKITFTMASGTAYEYTDLGYLIEQQLDGTSGGGKVVSSSVVQNPAKLAAAEVSISLETLVPKSSRQILAKANENPVVKRFAAHYGKKYRLDMDSFFREKERALRQSGARPSF